jgi:hypothetical protein
MSVARLRQSQQSPADSAKTAQDWLYLPFLLVTELP